MNIDEIKHKLIELDKDILKDFVLDLYLHYPELKDKIETLVLYNDPVALAKAILKRIQSIKRGRKFIDYHASFDFSRRLDSIYIDIESGLLDGSPQLAFDLIDKFLATANKVFERADDSAGYMSEVYRNAVLLWLTAAKAWQSSLDANHKINWLERVYELYLGNNYGVFDLLLPNSHILLSHEQLTQLALRYESELRQVQKKFNAEDKLNMDALTSSVALRAVAEALNDPALYERATLITSPKPNDLEKKSIIKMYLQFKQTDEALRWLNTPWESRFEGDRLGLLDDAYLQNGDAGQLKQTRYQYYQCDKTYHSFQRYLELLNDKEKESAQDKAIRQAEQGDDVFNNADMLLSLGEAERAQALVLSRGEEIADCFYTNLLKLASKFDEQNCLLAATLCYRTLLLDILNHARSKAYGHAAKYYKKLTVMAKEIKHYAPLETHPAFVEQLEDKHGKKRSFWQRVQ